MGPSTVDEDISGIFITFGVVRLATPGAGLTRFRGGASPLTAHEAPMDTVESHGIGLTHLLADMETGWNEG